MHFRHPKIQRLCDNEKRAKQLSCERLPAGASPYLQPSGVSPSPMLPALNTSPAAEHSPVRPPAPAHQQARPRPRGAARRDGHVPGSGVSTVLPLSPSQNANSNYLIALICALVRSAEHNYILALRRVKEKKALF